MCENSSILSMLLLIKNLLNLLTIIVPIVLILYTMLDLIKNQIDVDKKYLKVIGKRFIYAVLIFLVPTVISLVINEVDEENKYLTCYKEATTENIKYYRAREEAEKKKEEETNNIAKEKADAERKQIENIRRILGEKNKQEKEGNPGSFIGNINQGNTCIYYQSDYRAYSYGGIGKATIASHGCGPTSCAVILCTMLKDPKYTPILTTNEICRSGGCTSGGTYFESLNKYLKSKGLNTRLVYGSKTAKSDFYNALSNNQMILIYVNGHFHVLSGLQDGKIRIVEVGSKAKSQKLYTYEELIALRGIKGYIVVSR